MQRHVGQFIVEPERLDARDVHGTASSHGGGSTPSGSSTSAGRMRAISAARLFGRKHAGDEFAGADVDVGEAGVALARDRRCCAVRVRREAGEVVVGALIEQATFDAQCPA